MEKFNITTVEGLRKAEEALKNKIDHILQDKSRCNLINVEFLISKIDVRGITVVDELEYSSFEAELHIIFNGADVGVSNIIGRLIDKYRWMIEEEKRIKDIAELEAELQSINNNGSSGQITKKFGKAFDACVEMYDNIKESNDEPFGRADEYDLKDIFDNISSLRLTHKDFIIGLYDKIKDVTDWNAQDVYFYQLKCFLPDRMFSGEFSQSEAVKGMNKVSDRDLRNYGLNLLRCLDEATKWYRDTTVHHLKAFCSMYKDFILDIKLSEIEDEMKYVLSYNEMFLSGINRYCGDDYVCTDYDKNDFEKAYYLFKSHNDKLLGLINFYDVRNVYRNIKYGLNLKYPIIKQFICNYEDITKIMNIHVFVNKNNDVNLIENTGNDIPSINIVTPNEQIDTLLVQEKISMAPEDYAKFIANSEYQQSQYDEMVDKQIEVPNVVEIYKKSMLEINILHQYLTGDKDSFNHILTHKVPKDGKKCSWIGKLTDAVIFADYLDMTTTQFNKCFTLSKGGELKDSNRGRKEAKDSPLYAILYPKNQ